MNVALRTAWAHARWLAPLACRSVADLFAPADGGEIHLILAIADHFEPGHGDATEAVAAARVRHWVETYPEALGGFRDADGRPPRHTFFYPVEAFDDGQVEALAGLCRQGYGEVEVHLHHHDDTPDSLRETLSDAVRRLSAVHGLLGRHRETGEPGYAFVHGNWALNNARPDGCWCGVDDEIRVLRETGCYADLTFPSAPSPTQPPTVNRIYHARGNPSRPRGHDRPAAIGHTSSDALMMIPGPLLLNWESRKFGVVPRVENSCLQGSQPPTAARLERWLRARVGVPERPDWRFVKLHAHGAQERDRDALLGPPMRAFHEALARRSADDPRFSVHYVTAREMYNLAAAAGSGWQGAVDGARDFAYVWGRPAPVGSV